MRVWIQQPARLLKSLEAWWQHRPDLVETIIAIESRLALRPRGQCLVSSSPGRNWSQVVGSICRVRRRDVKIILDIDRQGVVHGAYHSILKFLSLDRSHFAELKDLPQLAAPHAAARYLSAGVGSIRPKSRLTLCLPEGLRSQCAVRLRV